MFLLITIYDNLTGIVSDNNDKNIRLFNYSHCNLCNKRSSVTNEFGVHAISVISINYLEKCVDNGCFSQLCHFLSVVRHPLIKYIVNFSYMSCMLTITNLKMLFT
jgi:hypothetical protein